MGMETSRTKTHRRDDDDPADGTPLDTQLEEFSGELRIDRDALDEAIQMQPDLFWRVSQVLTLQISRRDAAKQELATQEALTDAYLRRATTEKNEKITVKEIEAQIRINSKVVRATEKLLALNHSVNKWDALRDAIIQRGHALRELVTLYVNEYFSSSGSVNISKMREQRASEARRLERKQRQ